MQIGSLPCNESLWCSLPPTCRKRRLCCWFVCLIEKPGAGNYPVLSAAGQSFVLMVHKRFAVHVLSNVYTWIDETHCIKATQSSMKARTRGRINVTVKQNVTCFVHVCSIRRCWAEITAIWCCTLDNWEGRHVYASNHYTSYLDWKSKCSEFCTLSCVHIKKCKNVDQL